MYELKVRNIVRRHGESAEMRADEEGIEVLDWYGSGVIATKGADQYELTKSERRARAWVREEFNLSRKLRRYHHGIDFVYGNVGFEVKSSEWYKLSEIQLTHAKHLRYTIILLSTSDGVEVMDVLDRSSIIGRMRDKRNVQP